jgi:RNA polymerase subunit RPABC4/transcription elongation factor Spt4
MTTKEKACLNCRIVFEGERCPLCNETAFTGSYKGRIYVFNSAESEIAKNMKINNNGLFAIKTK